MTKNVSTTPKVKGKRENEHLYTTNKIFIIMNYKLYITENKPQNETTIMCMISN